MGVNGLWQVLQPCARPTNLATLNRKRLAVDASIWIYQFLKAVRDKEGNALRNSHVVGFFRRICKLLWFGIKPVFVFDGGAPALKRATLQGRRRRREGRRDDAVRTAGKLLAVQMQRIAVEEEEKRKVARQDRAEREERARQEQEEEALPDMENIVYAEEAFAPKPERQQNRKYFRQDQYHLPDLDKSIEQMGQPDDPRIMSVEELEEYARQFNSGEDFNVYDFSKIDFDGDFFKSLPPADRYNILNAARLRSRLRMGLSKEQLEDMFPDRMAFSRFQVERVQERNYLTQRLMAESDMTGADLTMSEGGRIVGEKNREYVLVKNDGVEGGYALGVVSKERDVGQAHKPIDVDALQYKFETVDGESEETDDEFEDVPIEGVNRLLKRNNAGGLNGRANQAASNDLHLDVELEDEEALFVEQAAGDGAIEHNEASRSLMLDEDEDIERAIEMSLKAQHGADAVHDEEEEGIDFEDVPPPTWEQKAVEAAKPIVTSNGRMVAHVINNRANASVKRRREQEDSDSDDDIGVALAAARKKRKEAPKPKPTKAPVSNSKNPFDGPLPFEKLDLKPSTSGRKPLANGFSAKPEPFKGLLQPNDARIEASDDADVKDDDQAGGFERESGGDAVQDLPPWMQSNERDIRDSIKEQKEAQIAMDEEDKALAREEQRLYNRKRQDQVVEIDSSDDDDDVVVVERQDTIKPSSAGRASPKVIHADPLQESAEHTNSLKDTLPASTLQLEEAKGSTPSQHSEVPLAKSKADAAAAIAQDVMPEPEFEVVDPHVATPEGEVAQVQDDLGGGVNASVENGDAPELSVDMEGVQLETTAPAIDALPVDMDPEFEDQEYEVFSDPEDEELMAQMAEEAQEHARFANQLSNKTTQTAEDFERDLKALRTQQQKDRRDADEVTQVMVTECQSLLRLFGIPYITAPMEAEAQCAELVQLGLVDGIVTDDSDTFLFGGTRVYKNMFNSNKYVECYLGTDLEKELSLSREQLISLAHLLGSDYTEGIPGIGPVTAVEILSEFPGKDGLIEFKDWWQDVQQRNRPKDADASSPFRRKFRKSQAAKLFLPPGFPSLAVYEAYLKPDIDSDSQSFQWGIPDLDMLRQFLMATIGWSQERTDEVLVPVIRDMNRREAEGTQSNITRFFEGGVGVGAKAKEGFAPKQKAKASKRMVSAVNKLRNKAALGDSETIDADDDGNQGPAKVIAKRPRRVRKVNREADNSDDSYNVDDDE